MPSRETGMDNGNVDGADHDAVVDGVDIALTVEDDRWADVLGTPPSALVFPAVAAALAGGCDRKPGSAIHEETCLGLTFTNDAAVRTLNRDYRGRDSATNVLSFALQDGEALPQPDGAPIELGDLVLAYETILRESDLQGRPVRHHLTHLIVHGVLHLLGYDHMTDDEAAEMESLEIDILRRLAIPDPYRIDPEPTHFEEETPAAGRADGLP